MAVRVAPANRNEVIAVTGLSPGTAMGRRARRRAKEQAVMAISALSALAAPIRIGIKSTDRPSLSVLVPEGRKAVAMRIVFSPTTRGSQADCSTGRAAALMAPISSAARPLLRQRGSPSPAMLGNATTRGPTTRQGLIYPTAIGHAAAVIRHMRNIISPTIRRAVTATRSRGGPAIRLASVGHREVSAPVGHRAAIRLAVAISARTTIIILAQLGTSAALGRTPRGQLIRAMTSMTPISVTAAVRAAPLGVLILTDRRVAMTA